MLNSVFLKSAVDGFHVNQDYGGYYMEHEYGYKFVICMLLMLCHLCSVSQVMVMLCYVMLSTQPHDYITMESAS